MLRMSKIAAVIAFAVGGLTLQAGGASALPVLDTHPAQVVRAEAAPGVEQARIVCGPFRCFYRPGFYHRPFYGYGYGYHRHFGYGGYGYHRHFGYGGYGYHRGFRRF